MNIEYPQDIGILIQKTRKAQGLTQTQLAAASGVGVRFIVNLENGKPSCHLGKTLHVLHMLGIHLHTDQETIS